MTPRTPVLLVLAFPAILLAQPITARAQSPGVGLGDRWSISMFRFWTHGGPSDDLGVALTREHFSDTIPPAGSFGGGVSPPVPTPVSLQGPEPGWAVAVGYRLTKHVDVELNANRTVRMAEVLGFNLGAGARMNTHTTVAARGVTTGLRFGPVRLAAGPIYYRTHVQTEDRWVFTDPMEYVPAEHDEDGAFGALLGVGIVAPVRSRILVQARAEFRWVGDRSVGPFESVGWAGERVSFSPQQIGFNHGVLMLGVGVRP